MLHTPDISCVSDKLLIDKALMVSPSSPEALELNAKIDQLPVFLDLLREAKIAQVENDIEKEYVLLRDALKVAPDRNEIKSQVAFLQKKIADQRFSDAISKGLDAADKGKLSKAKSSLATARKIYSARPEVAILKGKIIVLEKELELVNLLDSTKTAMANDQWGQAHALLSKAVKEHPSNRDVIEGLELSTKITELNQSLGLLLRERDRLASRKVRISAKSTLIIAEVVSVFSPGLKKQVIDLGQLIEQYNKKVSVTVVSDNQTNIIVRGVGKVGVTREKVIKLTPGKYVFEGKRIGFKSKLVSIVIPIDQSSVEVKIISDEPV